MITGSAAYIFELSHRYMSLWKEEAAQWVCRLQSDSEKPSFGRPESEARHRRILNVKYKYFSIFSSPPANQWCGLGSNSVSIYKMRILYSSTVLT